MKCDICDSEATVFLTQIIDGKMTQVNLCDKCSRDQGVTDPTGFQLADNIFETELKKPGRFVRDADSQACQSCGFTRAHLKKIGRLGCPECYQIFSEDLDSMLRAMHKGTRHVGKSPSRTALNSPEPNTPVGDLGKRKPAIAGTPSVAASQITPPMPPPITAPAPPAPPTPPTTAQLKRRLAEIKAAIDKAVEDERYEDAAKLRDEAKEIEARLA